MSSFVHLAYEAFSRQPTSRHSSCYPSTARWSPIGFIVASLMVADLASSQASRAWEFGFLSSTWKQPCLSHLWSRIAVPEIGCGCFSRLGELFSRTTVGVRLDHVPWRSLGHLRTSWLAYQPTSAHSCCLSNGFGYLPLFSSEAGKAKTPVSISFVDRLVFVSASPLQLRTLV